MQLQLRPSAPAVRFASRRVLKYQDDTNFPLGFVLHANITEILPPREEPAMEDEDPGVPEWVVTYGDMMSLLLTFFRTIVFPILGRVCASHPARWDAIRPSDFGS